MEKIHNALEELTNLFESVGRSCGWTTKARRAMQVSDETVLCRTIHSWFGGMGSLNDQVLCRVNGDQGSETELKSKQKQLEKCIGRLFSLSKR